MNDAPLDTETPRAQGRERWPPPVLSGSGILLGSLLAAASLTPSLVPRDALMQGLVGGAVFAIGYAVAVAILMLWRWLELFEPSRRHSTPWAIAAALLGIAVVGFTLYKTTDWQNAIRELMQMPPVEGTHPQMVLGVAVGTAAAIFLVAYLLRRLIHFVAHRSRRVMPPRLALVIGLTAGFAFAVALVDGVLLRGAFAFLDSTYAALDRLMEPDQVKPTEPWQTGSTQSLVPWTTLGRDGRRFVDGITRQSDIEAFWGGPATQPRRVYVGLGSGDDAEERATLALEELKRVGGFERDVLLLALPTGTGFMDPGAIATLEYLHKGDVATVAAQYSYMQSPFALIFEPDAGAEAGTALMRIVYDYWTDLPHDARPKLYLYGLSLGALSSERSLRLRDVIGDPVQGALWVGPPFPSPIHTDITRYREPGSPEWLPSFEGGRLVRTMNQDSLTDPDAPWGPLRILYFQHASDPIVFFDYSLLWQRPDWMREPRAPDVVGTMNWYPIVTALQVAADMAVSTNVPRGFGHEYAAERHVDAWVTLTDPDVTAEEIARLKARFGE
ncbi:alpha/beta-hydrolase family protein [Acuticoccus sp. I52.16.1]|uniref:alpha/beta hydrolase n=1 Tax=Acuticoccus sp. I52.16.1 TaxID=2928472 RepID=UPI001FD24413|nr:alpha/beta-hydrolase family protein [Acuticoccus sp. I52.16.1]UOM33943.1 alpha/beta-hydrolase family protein [Acuticoccus sp. I52.16.1]